MPLSPCSSSPPAPPVPPMNSLYTLALRQCSTLQTDLTTLEQSYLSSTGATSSLHSQITTSLVALDRTVEDYDTMAKREIVEVKRVKALSRVARFREDYDSLRKQYDRIKTTGSSAKATADRDALLASSSAGPSSAFATTSSRRNRGLGDQTAESPFRIDMNAGNGSPLYSQSNQPPQHQLNNPYAHDSSFSASVHNNSRTKGALDESSYLASTGSALDAYIAQGTAVLGNLATQRDMLKGTKKRLLSAANTLGLSRNTIQYIERRTKGDFYILLGGGTFVLVSFYFILKWFG